MDGSYLVDIGTRELDALGWARRRVRVDIDARHSREMVEVQLESPLTAARAVCGGDAKLLGDRTGVIVGRVTKGATVVADREVRVWWSDRGRDSTAPRVVSRTTRSLVGDGRFLVCGVPRDQPIHMSADRITGVGATGVGATGVATTQLAGDQMVAIVALTVAR